MLYLFANSQNKEQIRAKQLACDNFKFTILIYSCLGLMFCVYTTFNVASAGASGAIGHLIVRTGVGHTDPEPTLWDTIYSSMLGALFVPPMYAYCRHNLQLSSSKQYDKYKINVVEAIFSGSIEATCGALLSRQLNSIKNLQHFLIVGALGHCIVDLSLVMTAEMLSKKMAAKCIKAGKINFKT